ncbi:MAG: hypothetical protein V1778_03640 [bacterium]
MAPQPEKTSRRNPPLRTVNPPALAEDPQQQERLPVPEHQRVWMMWAAVLVVMVGVVVGWLLVIRTPSSQRKSENPFQRVYEQVKGIFANDSTTNGTAVPATASENTALLTNLREEVFPQFSATEDHNVNAK